MAGVIKLTNEAPKVTKSTNLKRRYGDIKCKKCGGVGHNKRSCKGPPSNQQ
ncbi:uncharacterized protein G2W53_016227 [Senna tora]|uniref:CCHC-type domain-containing protein n=1 Tax=Senna tora TaxID=362788 RepID=A0A834WLB3_9FABA|nr:uncharacterized protein G2W53_016227 [Senna tora]